ncbi:hypothetical protein KCP69_14055 [Salmonella enterica subsp. enterica]|nr:hypothetical protein KCP69_14055 [Salmonella enterica subsp. enterica]
MDQQAPAGCFSLKMLDFTGASDEATFTVIKWPVLPQEWIYRVIDISTISMTVFRSFPYIALRPAHVQYMIKFFFRFATPNFLFFSCLFIALNLYLKTIILNTYLNIFYDFFNENEKTK